MRSPMIGFPLARGAALVDVTKGATAGFQRAPSLRSAVCDGGVNATSVTARGPRPCTRTRTGVDLGPLYGLMGVLRVPRCWSPGRFAGQFTLLVSRRAKRY